MKKYGKYLITAGIAGMALCLFYLSAAAWGGMIWSKDQVMLYLEQPVSSMEAEDVSKKNQEFLQQIKRGKEVQVLPEFCIWGQKEHVKLTNENLSRTILANAIFLCGSPELLFADCWVPVREDLQGCVLDEEAAFELFGSLEVVGKKVSFEGDTYIIRDIISGKGKIIAFQVGARRTGNADTMSNNGQRQPSGQETECVLSRITMRKPEGQSTSELQAAWMNQFGLSATILDMELLRGIGGGCVLLVPVTICVFFWVSLFFQYRKQDKLPGNAVFVILGLCLAILICFLLERWIRIPEDYIPTQWSEFSFWTDLWDRKIKMLKLLLQIPKTSLDHGWISNFFQMLGCGFFAEFILIIAFLAFNKLKYSRRYDKMSERL